MPNVVDHATGTVVPVDDAAATEGFKAGKFGLPPQKEYQVKLADGRFAAVPAAGVSEAVAAGATLTSREAAAAELQQRRDQQTAGGALGAGSAFGMEAMSQATGGLSDQALMGAARLAEKTGLRPKGYAWQFGHELQAPRQMHEVATAAGGALGAAALAAAVPGGGAGGAAEGAVGAGAEALGAGKTVLGRIAQRATVAAARGSVEGAQAAVAQSISDDAFQDHHLTAQQVLANVKGGALWGGALGAALGGASGILGEARAPRGTMSLSEPETLAASRGRGGLDASLASKTASDADVAAIAGRAVQAPPAEGLGAKLRGWYAKTASAVTGAKVEDIEPFLGGEMEEGSLAYENRRALMDADKIRDGASREIRGHVDSMLEASRNVSEEARGALKRGHLRVALEGADGAATAQRARDLADQALAGIAEMKGGAEEFGGQAPMKRAWTVAEGISKKLTAAIEAGDVAEQFGLVDDLKRAVGKYTKGAARLSPGAATDELIAMQNRARALKLKEVYEGLRVGLEDESVWGKAARDQKAINAAWTTQIDASERFHRALTTEVGRDPRDPWSTIRGVDPAKSDAYVRNLMNPAQDLTHKAVRDYVDSSKQLAGIMREAYELPPAKLAEVDRIHAAAEGFGKTLDRTEKTLALTNQFEKLREMGSGPSTGFAVMAGMASAGLPGGVLGMGLGKIGGLLTRPADTILQLAAVERMARESDGRIARALRGFAKGSARPVAPSPVDSFARKAEQVRQVSGDPSALADRMSANIGELRQRAPRLAGALTDAASAGLALLVEKLPPTLPKDPLDPTKKLPPPPRAQQAAWLRYYDAVQDPLSVVEDLRDGRLSPQGIEVLKTVYPRLFERVQGQTMDLMSSGKMRGLDPQRRLGLSLMLDLPAPELDPGYILRRQSAFQSPEAAEPAQESPPRRGKPVNLTKAFPPTGVERLESGGSP